MDRSPAKPLGEIADVRLGKMLDKAKHTSGTKLPYLRNVNVRWGTVDMSDLLEMYFRDDELERFGLLPGDVLVCEGGEPGRASVWDGAMPDLKYQKALHRVRFRIPYEPRLFVYQMELLAASGLLEQRFTGSTIKHLTGEAFKQLPVPVMPIEEQAAIVAEIETQLSRLDAGVAALKRAQVNLKRYRASVLKAACEGRLVPTEAELARREGRDYETGAQLLERILAERRKAWTGKGKYKEPEPPDTSGLPELPEGWCWATVGQVVEAALGKMLDKAKHLDGESRPYLRNANVRWRWVDTSDLLMMRFRVDEIDRYSVLPGDVLVCEGGEPGRAAEWPGPGTVMYQKALHRLRPYARLRPEWLVLWLQWSAGSNNLDSWFTGSTIKHLTGESFVRLPVRIPPAEEQAKIVAESEARLGAIGDLDTALMQSEQRAGGLRRAVLREAFGGWVAAARIRGEEHEYTGRCTSWPG